MKRVTWPIQNCSRVIKTAISSAYKIFFEREKRKLLHSTRYLNCPRMKHNLDSCDLKWMYLVHPHVSVRFFIWCFPKGKIYGNAQMRTLQPWYIQCNRNKNRKWIYWVLKCFTLKSCVYKTICYKSDRIAWMFWTYS